MEKIRSYLLWIAYQEVGMHLQAKVAPSSLVQDSFYLVHRDFAAFQGDTEQDFKSWVRGILKHKILGAVRKYCEGPSHNINLELPLVGGGSTHELPAKMTSPLDQMIAQNDQHRLLEALRGLPKKDQAVIRLRLEGKSWPEVGSKVRLSPDAARVRWGRAVEKLREQLGGRHESC
jgi:RNA polymerase sigma-70 factor (ECF subfamily)